MGKLPESERAKTFAIFGSYSLNEIDFNTALLELNKLLPKEPVPELRPKRFILKKPQPDPGCGQNTPELHNIVVLDEDLVKLINGEAVILVRPGNLVGAKDLADTRKAADAHRKKIFTDPAAQCQDLPAVQELMKQINAKRKEGPLDIKDLRTILSEVSSWIEKRYPKMPHSEYLDALQQASDYSRREYLDTGALVLLLKKASQMGQEQAENRDNFPSLQSAFESLESAKTTEEEDSSLQLCRRALSQAIRSSPEALLIEEEFNQSYIIRLLSHLRRDGSSESSHGL